MYPVIKRIIDFCVALIALLVLSPLFILTALAIKMDSRGPVLFKQERLGYKGKVYKILKFRSMCVGAEHQGSGVYSYKGDKRITRVGRILRSTSIDELPQLVNIIRGEMSLIGPRPALTYHPWPFNQYTDHQKHMFDVLPGITGWAQVHGRKEVPWPERIEMNIYYVDHLSFVLDCKILLMTVFKVATNADNNNTTETK